MRFILACVAVAVIAHPALAQKPEAPPADDKTKGRTPDVPTIEATITVTGGAPPGEGHAAVGQLLTDHLAHAVPLFGRNFLHLASLAAGYTGHPSYPSPQGQIYWANNVLVDGASHFSKWRSAPRAFHAGYGLESIREVQVLTNRFSAEHGDALASITSAVTRAGTNQWRGTGLVYWQDEALGAKPPFAVRKLPSELLQYGGTLGGPLMRDRTHLLASYEGRRTRAFNPVVSPAASGALVPDNQDEHLAFVRVDHRHSAGHQFTARYNGQRFRWHDEPGGLVLPGNGTRWVNDVHTVLATTSSTLSPRLLHEGRAQFARYTERRTDLNPTTFVSRAGYSIEGGSLGPLGFGADPEDTWEAADTWLMSAAVHVVKMGVGVNHVRARNMLVPYGHGGSFYSGAPDRFPQPMFIARGVPRTPGGGIVNPRSLSGFAFVQDDWHVHPRFLVNAGLRYDLDRVYNVRNYGAPLDGNNVQPRVGVAWQVGERITVRGGAGLYTQQHLLYPINRAALEGDGGIAISWISPLSESSASSDVYRADPRLRNPYAVQASVGIEQQWRDRLTVSADYVYLAGRDLLSQVDVNAPQSNIKPNTRTAADADATRPVVPGPDAYRKIIVLGNEGRSWYHALQLKAGRTTGRLQTLVSYTLADAEDMANYELPEDSRNIPAERGRATSDVRHNLAGAVVWELPDDALGGRWTLSSVGTYRSNRPYNVTWGDDRNGTTQNDARPGGRNTGRTDSYATVDLSVSRRFTAGRATLDGRVEAFNILDTANFDQYVGTLLSPFFGRPVSAFAPRRVQLAAVIRF